ncbi:MAG: DUF1175 family protein [Deltaproteobacteria bacterium]|nr:DUF1175 family protein [Deltaproteobacteria bacterium]
MKLGRNIRVAIGVCAFVLVAFAVSVFLPVKTINSLVPDVLPANGSASARLIWSHTNIYGSPVPYYPTPTRVHLEKGRDKIKLLGQVERQSGPAYLELGIKAGSLPGEVVILVEDGDSSTKHSLRLVAVAGDRDRDGLPDSVELVDSADRNAFRAWFTSIAQAQFYKPDPRWDQVHQDCAGLARFAYKEALQKHDKSWFSKVPYLHRANQADVRRYNYPQVPIVGEKIFRIKPGKYVPGSDVASDFSASAGARALWEYNTVFVSKEIVKTLAGDLLIYRDPDHPAAPMHTMILLDPPDQPGGPRVVYHTGRIDDENPGEVRLVKVADLNSHRDTGWHVRPDNPKFLGFYRWKILEGGRP